MRRTSLLFLTTISLFAAAACEVSNVSGIGGGPGSTTSTGSTVTEVACDPLAPKPITLGGVVGVGKDAAGTLYVDAANGVFVSGGGKLIRQHVTGTGQSGSNEYAFWFVAPGADDATGRNLMVETTGGVADAMALGSDPKGFIGQSSGTPLTLVDPATVAGMALVNTPNVIRYVADVANGDILLGTAPMNEDPTSKDGGLAIFYGPPGAVAQRAVTDFEQSLSGNGTLTFLVGGTPYVLAFGQVYGPDAGPLGDFALMSLTPQGGAPLGVTLRSPTPATLPSGLSFTCLP
jgi:hypothetical protein